MTFVVDRSERGKLALTGPDAKTFLHGQVTQDIESLTPGHGGYAAFLTHMTNCAACREDMEGLLAMLRDQEKSNQG